MLSHFFSLSLAERLWISTPIAIFLSTLIVLAILRVDPPADQRAVYKFKFEMAVTRIGLAALLTAILYFQALFVVGYLGYRGSANVMWIIGIPASACLVSCRGSLRRAVIFFPFVLFLGFVTTGLISMLTGLPVD